MTRTRTRTRRGASIVTGVLAFALVLTACTAGDAPQPGEPEVPEAPAFEGTIGVDWARAGSDILFDYLNQYDIAVGAGALWMLSDGKGVEVDGAVGASNPVEPVLLTSHDGEHWTEVDYQALGIPASFDRRPFLISGTDRITVVFRAPHDGDDAPAILVGEKSDDGVEWSVTLPEAFAPWSLTDRRGMIHKPLLIGGGAWVGDTLMLIVKAQYRPPGDAQKVGSTDESFSFMRLGPNGAERIADSGEPLGGERLLRIGSTDAVQVVAHNDSLNFFAGTADSGALHFTHWSTTDLGETWTSTTVPTATSTGAPYVTLHDSAVLGDRVVLVGSNADESIIVTSDDLENWHSVSIPETDRLTQVAATKDGFWAFNNVSDPGGLWHSIDGVEWDAISTDEALRSLKDVVGTPDGLIAIIARVVSFSGITPPHVLP